MGRAKNTLSTADVSSTPIKVQYVASYPSSSLPDLGFAITTGSNIEYSVYLSDGQLESLTNYRMIRQVYYQTYLSGSLLNSASFWDPMWQSTAASASGDATIYYFPTESSSPIGIIAIPPQQFGEQVSRNTFFISSSDATYFIQDDGNGNLIDTLASNKPIGNIFYAQGIVIITDPDYVPADYLATEIGDIYNTENNIDIIIE